MTVQFSEEVRIERYQIARRPERDEDGYGISVAQFAEMHNVRLNKESY